MSTGNSVLLLTPPIPGHRRASFRVAEESCPPMGLLYLASNLLKAGVSCRVVDGYAASTDLVLPGLLEYAVVGISFTTPLAPQAFALARDIKRARPSCLIVAGGHHATALPEDCLAHAPFDVILAGEAEDSLCHLVSAVHAGVYGGDLLDIPGAVIMAGNEVRKSQSGPHPVDINKIPRPARELVDLNTYSQAGAIVASRGCTGRCIFCSAGLSGVYHRREPDDVIDEIAEFVCRYANRDIFFLDDAFTVNRLWVTSVCQRLLSLRPPIRWSCSARASDVDSEMLSLMAAAGCRAIHFGAESGDSDVLSGLRKGCTPDQIEASVTEARRVGVDFVSCSFIIGAPDDTEDTAAKTITFAAKLRRLGATHTPFSIMTPYPGSLLFQKPEAFGVNIHSFDWNRYIPTVSNISTQHLTRRRIEELYFDAISSLLEQ